MFVGHYSVSFAARRVSSDVPLWVWFVAVQWLDLFFMVFVLTGVEKMRIVPGYTQSNSLDLYSMPYSHGLIGAAVLSLVFAVLAALFCSAARRPGTFVLLALAVFSHWLLDLLVHTPDLALFDKGTKVGLGLWNHLAVELPLELILVALFAWIYTRGADPARTRRTWILVALMLVLQVYSTFGPTPKSPTAFAVTALVAYVLLILGARWVERSGPDHQTSISSAP
jgi:hypothetical protein